MSARGHDDDQLDQNQEGGLFNVDNHEYGRINSNNSDDVSGNRNEDNDYAFNYESALPNLGIDDFKRENMPNEAIFGNERYTIIEDSFNDAKENEELLPSPYSSDNLIDDSTYNIADENDSFSLNSYRIIKSKSLNNPSSRKSQSKRMCHSTATSPYQCRSVRKKNEDSIPLEIPKPPPLPVINPPQSLSFVNNSSILSDENDDSEIAYSNNPSFSVSSGDDSCDSFQLIQEQIIPQPPPNPPSIIQTRNASIPQQKKERRLRIQSEQQSKQQSPPPPPLHSPLHSPLSTSSSNNNNNNNSYNISSIRDSIKTEPISPQKYYPQFILPKIESNDSINEMYQSTLTIVGYGSCRCESGRCSNGNCGCLKNGLECGKDCYCRLKGMVCENGREKREKKMNQKKQIKCSCTKSGCSKGKCTCKKYNSACSSNCTCACNLKRFSL